MLVDCRLTIFTFVVSLGICFFVFGFFQVKQYPSDASSITKGKKLAASSNSSLVNSNIVGNELWNGNGTGNVTGNNSPYELRTVSMNRTIPSINTSLKYYIIAPPQYTDSLLGFDRISDFYKSALNEESAEIWLHRAFVRGTLKEDGHTLNASEADVFFIAGYFHLNASVKRPGLGNETDMIQRYKDLIVDKSKPHLLLAPSWNPGKSKGVGISPLSQALERDGVNIYSVGMERNSGWQGVKPRRIVPIPYVVRQSLEQRNDQSYLKNKTPNSIFYSGDARHHAQEWGGCYRENMILPLMGNDSKPMIFPNVDVRIVGKFNRLTEVEYNHRMTTSEYCLILCGDTPTSRSLTAAIVSGCIPIFVGSRLRGLCEPPCQKGFGWEVTGKDYPHLAFPQRMPWEEFPEVDEFDFTQNGPKVLQDTVFAKFNETKKSKLRTIMADVREGWIYGWGDPVTSDVFGNVHRYLLEDFENLVNSNT